MKIEVVSGFLGAGKTTLIKKLIEWKGDSKIALIENEFGEIGIDGPLLQSEGIEMREISSGCICCSVAGDFKKAIEEIRDNYGPDKIIIEPTGLGKLSQIRESIASEHISSIYLITVADSENYADYLENFGEFFEDQIKNADTVYISRAEERTAEEIREIENSIRELNPDANIVAGPLGELKASDFYGEDEEKEVEHNHDEEHHHEAHAHEHSGCHSHGDHEHDDHHHHDHAHDYEHGHDHHHHHHDHSDTANFETMSLELDRVFSRDEVQNIMDELDRRNGLDGEERIVRAKGILKGDGENIHFEYLPKTMNIEASDIAVESGILTVIGIKLDREAIEKLFRG